MSTLMHPNNATALAHAKTYLFDLFASLAPKRKLLAQLRARWGMPGSKDGFLASRYFELVRQAPPDSWVDEKTWKDLEFPEIFSRMDTTVTPIGSQVLFARLRKYIEDPDMLARRYSLYGELATDANLRETLQLRLSRLEDGSNAELADFLFGDRADRPAHRFRILGWGLLSAVLLALVASFGWPIWIWLAVIPINTAVIFRGALRQQRELEAVKRCAALLGVADKLAALQERHTLPQLARLRDDSPQRAAVRKILFWPAIVNVLSSIQPPVFLILFSLLNFTFLTDFALHALTIERLLRMRSKLHASFELVGEIDAIIAIASFLRQYRHHCTPSLVEDRVVSIVDGCHPLLPKGISNSIRLDHRSALVTGSNMAGKTTFIKMLASNAILGQTAGFCLASAATLPRSQVMASIHDAHSVASGKSHYFCEIEAIDGFIRNGAPGRLRIIAIDEPFSGTNTVERIAVARAVLETLAAQAIVLVTTHDVELQACLGAQYTLYHFQENPDVDGFFDYELKSGPATARNAIKLLERLGSPHAITTAALNYSRHSASHDAIDDPSTRSTHS